MADPPNGVQDALASNVIAERAGVNDGGEMAAVPGAPRFAANSLRTGNFSHFNRVFLPQFEAMPKAEFSSPGASLDPNCAQDNMRMWQI